MRHQLVETLSSLMAEDERVTLLLGDIGVFGFRNAFANFPSRTYNIGILEQSTVSVAAGLAMVGLIPAVHTIAPFLVERSFEQLKVDFGYQHLTGNFISVGASYDYAGLGCTHHCPGDVGILMMIPEMGIMVPGTAKEFDTLFRATYDCPGPRYFRLSEESNSSDCDVVPGKANLLQTGSQGTVLAVGPMLQAVRDAVQDMDVTVLYYTSVRPFDADTLRAAHHPNTPVIVCEPFYQGALTLPVTQALEGMPVAIRHIGIPHKFIRNYGTARETSQSLGLDAASIRAKIQQFLGANG